MGFHNFGAPAEEDYPVEYVHHDTVYSVLDGAAQTVAVYATKDLAIQHCDVANHGYDYKRVAWVETKVLNKVDKEDARL